MLMKNLKVPVCWMPSRKCRLIDAPFASGVPKVTVPAESVELKPPPFGCEGGCSKVVPSTLTVQGVVATPFEARHVAASLMPETTTSVEVRGRRSAKPDGTGKVVKSTMRKRRRVTFGASIVEATLLVKPVETAVEPRRIRPLALTENCVRRTLSYQ